MPGLDTLYIDSTNRLGSGELLLQRTRFSVAASQEVLLTFHFLHFVFARIQTFAKQTSETECLQDAHGQMGYVCGGNLFWQDFNFHIESCYARVERFKTKYISADSDTQGSVNFR